MVVLGIFATLALRGVIDPQRVVEIMLVVVSFYFGSQSGKADEKAVVEADNTKVLAAAAEKILSAPPEPVVQTQFSINPPKYPE